jgi:hypothetical protein
LIELNPSIIGFPAADSSSGHGLRPPDAPPYSLGYTMQLRVSNWRRSIADRKPTIERFFMRPGFRLYSIAYGCGLADQPGYDLDQLGLVPIKTGDHGIEHGIRIEAFQV